MEKGKYIVFFDLDGTLISVNSGYALVKEARRRKMITPVEIARALCLSVLYKLKVFSAGNVIKSMGKWLKGTDHSLFRQVAISATERYLVSTVYPEALDEIKLHREKKATIVLLTSAVAEIAEYITENLGLDACVSTVMESHNGTLTGNPMGEYCYGTEKEKRLLEFCRINGYEPSDSFCYADASSDLPALLASGHPVCVNPDRKLRRTAINKGWPVRDWKKG